MAYDFIEQAGVGAGFVYKTTTACYYFNGTTFNQVTDAEYPTTTVRGIVYLDGTYYVMGPDGAIYGSAINDITSWDALNVIQCQMESDGGVCLARVQNLIVAFGQYSTEFFYDAGNATGSPLGNYASSALELGCAVAESVAQTENTLFFMGVARQKGRSIYRMDATTPQVVSTPFIDRLLNADNLSDCTAYCIKLSGHGFYILTLRNSGITLAYDMGTGQWAKWTSLTLGSTKNISAASWANNQVSVTTSTAHGFSDGDCVVIASSNPSGYNGTWVINYVDSTHFTYDTTTDPGTYVGSGTVAGYTETYFNMSSYCKAGNFDLVQDSTTGTVYAMSTGVYTDNGVPIKYHIRTSKFDAGDNKNKYYPKLEIIGDKVSATAYVRYSNDDYQTWSAYRPVSLSQQRSQLYRLGRGRRRAFDIINYDTQPIRMEALELTVEEGIR